MPPEHLPNHTKSRMKKSYGNVVDTVHPILQNEMKISDPVTREREIRYIQDQLDSLMSGSPYDRDEIGSEITIETAKP